jgi:hypothetical protein
MAEKMIKITVAVELDQYNPGSIDHYFNMLFSCQAILRNIDFIKVKRTFLY